MKKTKAQQHAGDFPDVKAAKAKLEALRRERHAVTHEIAALEAARNRGDPTAARGTALLDGDEEGAKPRPDARAALEDRLRVLDEAIRQGEVRQQRATAAAHRKIAEGARSGYRQMAARLAEGARAFGEALDAESEFFHALGPAGNHFTRLTFPGGPWKEGRWQGMPTKTKLGEYIDRVETAATPTEKTHG